MTPEEFAAKMREIAAEGPDGDIDEEAAHGAADKLMLEVLRSLGYGEGCDTFINMPKWYA